MKAALSCSVVFSLVRYSLSLSIPRIIFLFLSKNMVCTDFTCSIVSTGGCWPVCQWHSLAKCILLLHPHLFFILLHHCIPERLARWPECRVVTQKLSKRMHFWSFHEYTVKKSSYQMNELFQAVTHVVHAKSIVGRWQGAFFTWINHWTAIYSLASASLMRLRLHSDNHIETQCNLVSVSWLIYDYWSSHHLECWRHTYPGVFYFLSHPPAAIIGYLLSCVSSLQGAFCCLFPCKCVFYVIVLLIDVSFTRVAHFLLPVSVIFSARPLSLSIDKKSARTRTVLVRRLLVLRRLSLNHSYIDNVSVCHLLLSLPSSSCSFPLSLPEERAGTSGTCLSIDM